MLAKNELDILEKIVGYGGYVTKEILHLYRTEISQDRCYRILTQLERKGYIRKRYYFQSSREPIVYQVTRKACAHFNRPEAYMRKVHKPYAVRRYLIRSHFLFAFAGTGATVSFFSSASRKDYLISRGFAEYYLPKKTNNGQSEVQIEEYILDQVPVEKGQEIQFLYTDNIRYAPAAQLQNLYSTYGRMIRSLKAHLDFLIITENQHRADQFKTEYERAFRREISIVTIREKSIGRNYQSQII